MARALGEYVELRRKFEVGRGEAALGVGGDSHRDRVPGDLQIGVVAHLLGRSDEGLDELDRADEVTALEALDDRLALTGPTGQVGQPCLDLRFAKQRHRPYAGRRTATPQ